MSKKTDRREAAQFKKWALTLVKALEWARDVGFLGLADDYLRKLVETTTGPFQITTREYWTKWAAVEAPADRHGVLNAYIGWLRDRIAQCELVGQTIDYSGMAIGATTPLGVVIERCPKCGRPAVIAAEGAAATHSERFVSWGFSVTQSCNLALPDEIKIGDEDWV